jgi:hypothetical protein
MASKTLLKASAILWGIWGIVHLLAGISLIFALRNGVNGLPESLSVGMMGSEISVHPLETLKEHNWNNSWFGLVATIGAFGVWKGNRNGIFLSAVVGGLAQLGFFIFVVLPYPDPAGITMSFVAAAAIVLSLIAYFSSTKTMDDIETVSKETT